MHPPSANPDPAHRRTTVAYLGYGLLYLALLLGFALALTQAEGSGALRAVLDMAAR